MRSGFGSSRLARAVPVSRSQGCGAFSSGGNWFTIKELLPIVVACAVWGNSMKGKTVRIKCDNAAVVAILKSGTSKDGLAMHLLRSPFFYTAYHQVFIAP